MRGLFFRLFLVLLVAALLELVGYLLMRINSTEVDWLWSRSYLKTRAMLLGSKNADELPRYLTLPFLGYIPYPGYEKYDVIQHNEDGYRGVRVSLQKSDKYRILCLGGSTTYGLGVKLPTEAYPAQLELLLNNYIYNDSVLKKSCKGVEVINAGIEAATSAETLQQYLFKYRYYKPDAVIVHSGVNDAELMHQNSSDFQLDYTHYRRLQFHLDPLSQPARFLMHSYLISFFVIRLFYDNFNRFGDTGKDCFGLQQNQTYCRWTTVNEDSILKNNIYSFIPYYRNTRTLFNEIRNDSVALFVLPNILNPNDDYVKETPFYFRLNDKNIAITNELAKQVGGFVIPFAYDSIKNRSAWIDDCHLDAGGEKNKAEIVFTSLLSQIKRGYVH